MLLSYIDWEKIISTNELKMNKKIQKAKASQFNLIFFSTEKIREKNCVSTLIDLVN